MTELDVYGDLLEEVSRGNMPADLAAAYMWDQCQEKDIPVAHLLARAYVMARYPYCKIALEILDCLCQITGREMGISRLAVGLYVQWGVDSSCGIWPGQSRTFLSDDLRLFPYMGDHNQGLLIVNRKSKRSCALLAGHDEKINVEKALSWARESELCCSGGSGKEAK